SGSSGVPAADGHPPVPADGHPPAGADAQPTEAPSPPVNDPALMEKPGLYAPRSRGRSTKLIGQVVVELGFANEEDVERAVQVARDSGRLTGRVLIEEGVLTPQQLARVLSERFGISRVDLSEFEVDPDVAHYV